MIWRVRADIPFESEDEARDFYHDCQLALPKGSVINPGLDTEEAGRILLEKCHHDEQPTEPCELISEENASPPV